MRWFIAYAVLATVTTAAAVASLIIEDRGRPRPQLEAGNLVGTVVALAGPAALFGIAWMIATCEGPGPRPTSYSWMTLLTLTKLSTFLYLAMLGGAAFELGTGAKCCLCRILGLLAYWVNVLVSLPAIPLAYYFVTVHADPPAPGSHP